MICLVDCNSFYVSCEKVFRPDLEGRAIIVLSNSDGCLVSLNKEAKKLNLKMGQPFFEVKHLCETHGLVAFSSNYELYGDFSSRVNGILSSFAARTEQYSIDESWLDLSGISDLSKYGNNIKDTVKRWTGIPVGVGIGHTKVLAKFANYLAKKYTALNGVCNLADLGPNRTDKAMQITPVEEIWGVGRRNASKLQQIGIKTVFDLKAANPKHISRIFNVNLERIILELNGIQCLQLEEYQEPNKQIISSRSFGTMIYERDALLSSLTYHVEQLSKKMRKQGLFARQMVVFANSNRFRDDYYYNAVNVVFPEALDSYRYMAKYLEPALDKIYRPEIGYKKSGIIINDLVTGGHDTVDLFDKFSIRHDKLLPTIENIKRTFGKTSIQLAAAKLSNQWKMKRDLLSPCYTTNINDIPTVS